MPRGRFSPDAISTPIRRMRSGCCALAASGHAAAAPPSRVMNSRRLICCPQSEGCSLPHRGRKYGVVHHSKFGGKCLSWVKNGPTAMSALSPHYPKLRTLVGTAGRSLVCQKLTHAPRQTDLVGAGRARWRLRGLGLRGLEIIYFISSFRRSHR